MPPLWGPLWGWTLIGRRLAIDIPLLTELPACRPKYSYLARVPERTTFLNLHASFAYTDQQAFHTAERTIEMDGDAIKPSRPRDT